ncbi:hypothetical protein MTR67_002525 [Solanum verrucosum]|uniref:Gag-pol polyprotein n=1 Tax=Solanum verrucosum TaxID=315347 RepID=A0AAF0PSK8_SOLVR|nr:hypothetical protein MTR67_002525 [Solanum verrucosum]
MNSLAFLGHLVSCECIKVDLQNIEVVKSWPGPTTLMEVSSFLGLVGYYRRFVEGFYTISTPLTKFTQKVVKFQWSDECEKIFQELKDGLTKEITTRRDNSRRLEERNVDQEVSPQPPPHAPIYPLKENVTNAEFRSAFQVLGHIVMAQANREVVAPVNPTLATVAAKVYKVLAIMGVTSVEHAELATYKLKEVARIWFNKWKETRQVEVGPIEWEKFKGAFLDQFFPLEMREAKVLEFINLM